MEGAQNWNPGESSGTNGNGRDGEFGGGGDRLLPLASVGRIMRERLPPNSRLSNEAKQAVQECASEFIRFVAEEAADMCKQGKRKSINGEDVIHAFHSLGFANYAKALDTLLYQMRAVKEEAVPPAHSSTAHQFTTPSHQDGQFVSQGATHVQFQSEQALTVLPSSTS